MIIMSIKEDNSVRSKHSNLSCFGPSKQFFWEHGKELGEIESV